MYIDEIKILLIEDNPNQAHFMIRALKKYNLADKLVWVTDGEEALDYIFAQGKYSDRSIEDTPNVILLDMHLPKIDGLEVLERIKSDTRTQSIPVIVLSSSPEEQRIAKSYKLSVNGYVLKPKDSYKYVDTIKEIGLCFFGLCH